MKKWRLTVEIESERIVSESVRVESDLCEVRRYF